MSIHQVRGISDDEVTSLEKREMTDIHQHTGSFPKSTSIFHKFFSSRTILWSDRGTTKNSKRSSSVDKEVRIRKLITSFAIFYALITMVIDNHIDILKNIVKS